MLNIPEIAVYDAVNKCLRYLKEDYLQASDKKKTWLYQNLNGLIIDKYDLFSAALNLLVLDKNGPKNLLVTIGYNFERAHLPTVHIIVPSDSPGPQDALGFDLDEEEDGDINSRSFNATYNLLITSSNFGEVTLLYHTIRALFITLGPMFDWENRGIRNLKISGADLTLQQDLMPVTIEHRMLNLDFFYEVNVKFPLNQSIIENIFTNGLIENPNTSQ